MIAIAGFHWACAQLVEYGDVGVPVLVLEAARAGGHRAEYRVRLPARPDVGAPRPGLHVTL